jgi:hypothetical protein
MKFYDWVATVIGALLCGACSSGNPSSACPEYAPVECSSGGASWCCDMGQTCAPISGLCLRAPEGCPAAFPVDCVTSCCPGNTRCGPNDTCLPLGSGGGGSGGAGGAAPTSGSGGKAASGGASGSNPGECASSSECPSATPCCELSTSGASHCAAVSDTQCRCSRGAECSSGACAPATNPVGAPVGPYVCVLNDGKAYHGCNGALTSCDTGLCCFTDASENEFCAKPCAAEFECFAGSACNVYSAAHTTCGGIQGCGPM